MVDYERGLGDLGFRHTKERGLGRRLGLGNPKSAARVCPRRRWQQQEVVAPAS